MKYDHLRRHIRCTLMAILLMVIFTLRKVKLNGKILLQVFPFLSDVATVYSVIAG